MTLEEAKRIIRDKSDKRWIRSRGQDYLNEVDVKKLKRAALRLLEELEKDER